jgi:hypothetical protein
MIVGDCEGGKVGLGEIDGDALGVGIWVGVGIGVVARFAVIVPGPFMVVVVELSVGNSNVMFPVSVVHEENV